MTPAPFSAGWLECSLIPAPGTGQAGAFAP
jgi:hypothetical protein